MRQGDLTLTVMDGKPNCLYIQHGAFSMYMVLHDQVCAVRNFLPDSIEPIENGYRLSALVESWHYLPFYPEKPVTSDWWQMDNPNTHQRMHNVHMTTIVEVTMQPDGVDIRICAESYEKIPLRVELTCQEGDVLTIDSGFADHGFLYRRDSAYLQSPEYFTVYMTAYTPAERHIRIGTAGFEKRDLLNWEDA